MSAELNHFRRAQVQLRHSLLAAPAVLLMVAAAATSQPAQAGDFEYLGRSLGGLAGTAAVGAQSQFGSPAAQAASMIGQTIAGRLGRGYDDYDDAKKRAEREDAQIQEQARREVVYEAARRREAQRQGIPYESMRTRAETNTAGYYGQTGYQTIEDRMNELVANSRRQSYR